MEKLETIGRWASNFLLVIVLSYLATLQNSLRKCMNIG